MLLIYVGLGQHTLLGIVGLCGASGNTLYWVLLLVDVGYCCWLCCASGNTLLAIVVGL
jgi:hypothetical protein